MILDICDDTGKPKGVYPTIHSMNEDGTGIIYTTHSGDTVQLSDTYSLDYKFGDTGHFRNLLTVSSSELINRTMSWINYTFFNDDYNDSENYEKGIDMNYLLDEFVELPKRVVMGMGTGLIRPNRLTYLSNKWSDFDLLYEAKTPERSKRECIFWKKLIKRVIKKPNHPQSDLVKSMMCVFMFYELLVTYKSDDKGNIIPTSQGLQGNNTMTLIDYPSEFGDIDFHRKNGIGPMDDEAKSEQEWLEFCGGSLSKEWTNLDMRKVS